ncbi:MAG: hypothetical protein KF836_05240 [Fimbriimonadaceae bacterium]|nr:hypothetical protein [Fimbriimonadaceae bacterium]
MNRPAKLFSLLLLVSLVGALIGCDDESTITTEESEQVRKEMSQEAYEDAMIKAGRGAELEQQKAAEEARRQPGAQDGV